MAKKLKPVHPGEILNEDFVMPYGLSMNKLALELRVAVTRIAFKTTPQFWLNLQTKYNLESTEDEKLAQIERDVRPIELIANR
jgi:plasmid maintenance system antidote protein VapI